MVSCHSPSGAGFELVSPRVRCSGPLGGFDPGWLSEMCAQCLGCLRASPRATSLPREVRAAGWALPYSGDDPGMEGEWWSEVLWASRKNACHHMGFVVRVVGMSPFSPLSLALRPLGLAHKCQGCPAEGSPRSPGPSWSGRAHTNQKGQVISGKGTVIHSIDILLLNAKSKC